MSIVVTTPTGNIGSVVTRALLDAGERPVLVARHPDKLADAAARGATVVQGDHGDAKVLTEATQGAEALFVCVPGNLQLDDIHAFYGRFAEAAAEAAGTNGIGHVVAVSSAGADRASGNGPVAGLYLLEQILGGAGMPNLTLLRPGYFMENTLAQIPSILQANRLFTTFPAGTRFPMIATRDIGARAAAILLAREAAGHRVVELHGGPETGYEEVASVLSEVLERPIEHVTISDEQLAAALTGMGVSPVFTEALVELSAAIASGHVAHREPRSAENTTPTDYATFAQEVFRPAFQGAREATA